MEKNICKTKSAAQKNAKRIAFNPKDDEKLMKIFEVYPFDWKRIA
jgi:hypothetical protein